MKLSANFSVVHVLHKVVTTSKQHGKNAKLEIVFNVEVAVTLMPNKVYHNLIQSSFIFMVEGVSTRYHSKNKDKCT